MYLRPIRYNQQQHLSDRQDELSNAAGYNRNNNLYNSDTYSTRSENVLTQLGSFRRQLQLEHLKMQEKLYHMQPPSQMQQHKVKPIKNQNRQRNNPKSVTAAVTTTAK